MLYVYALCLAGTSNYCLSRYINRAEPNNQEMKITSHPQNLRKVLTTNCNLTLPGLSLYSQHIVAQLIKQGHMCEDTLMDFSTQIKN